MQHKYCLSNIKIFITNNRLVLLLPIGSNYFFKGKCPARVLKRSDKTSLSDAYEEE